MPHQEVGCPMVHEVWVVCALVTLGEAQLVVGEFVDAPVGMGAGACREILCSQCHPLGATSAPQRCRPWSHEFGVPEHVSKGAFGSHVEVTAHKVDVRLLHVRV